MSPLFPRALRRSVPAAGAALLLLPAIAGAATATRGADGSLQIAGAPGEVNRLAVSVEGDGSGRYRVVDNMAIFTNATPAGCERPEWDSTGATLLCSPSPIVADLGDGDDQSTVWDGISGITVQGGAGDDWLDGGAGTDTIDGGPGTDRVRGYKGSDTLRGGDGNDEVDGGVDPDNVDGGAGDDLVSGDGSEGQWADVIDGGAGNDRITSDWSDRTYYYVQPPVTITLDDGPGDGRPGEGDDVRSVEHIAVNIPGTYRGTDGNDELRVRQVLGAVVLDGRGGNDTLAAPDGNDTLDGGAGDDDLDGGMGDDTITPGPGRDRVSGDTRGGDCGPAWCKYDYGNDTIRANDGEVDSINCGAGTDTVVADPGDVVAPDCEQVTRSTTPVTPHIPGTGPRATIATVRLSKALSGGIKVHVAGLKAKHKLQLTAKLAGKPVASGSGRTNASGTATVTLRFSKQAKRKLRGRKSVTLQISGGGLPKQTATLGSK